MAQECLSEAAEPSNLLFTGEAVVSRRDYAVSPDSCLQSDSLGSAGGVPVPLSQALLLFSMVLSSFCSVGQSFLHVRCFVFPTVSEAIC